MSLRHLRIVVTIAGLLVLSGLPRAAEQGAVGVAVMRDVMVADARRRAARHRHLSSDARRRRRRRSPADDPERTPYDKTGSERDGRYFAAHGYAFVVAGHPRPLSARRASGT